jgi:hypothetical protein
MGVEDAADFFWLGLQLALRLAIPARKPLDLLVHAAGVVCEGIAYLFVGPSGAGKSTVAKLSAQESAFTILHDDAVALSQEAEGFRAWSTPLGGEMPASRSISAPLGAIFFLTQDESTSAARLRGWDAMNMITPQMLPPVSSREGQVVVEHAESLKVLLTVVGCVPSYSLHFRPDLSFWNCIEELLSNEGMIGAVGKGEK